jgi:uncharacterized protein with GYD domain
MMRSHRGSAPSAENDLFWCRGMPLAEPVRRTVGGDACQTRIVALAGKEIQMPKYLVQASYLSKGIQGLLQEGGTRRLEAVEELFDSLGGKVEAFYFAFGEQDVYIIGELPDNASAASLVIKVNAAGTSTCRTVVLLTPQEVDEAVKKTSTYRPPGYEIALEVAKWEGEGGHLQESPAGGNQ